MFQLRGIYPATEFKVLSTSIFTDQCRLGLQEMLKVAHTRARAKQNKFHF